MKNYILAVLWNDESVFAGVGTASAVYDVVKAFVFGQFVRPSVAPPTLDAIMAMAIGENTDFTVTDADVDDEHPATGEAQVFIGRAF